MSAGQWGRGGVARGVAKSEARVWAVRLGCRRARAEAQIAGLGGAARTSRQRSVHDPTRHRSKQKKRVPAFCILVRLLNISLLSRLRVAVSARPHGMGFVLETLSAYFKNETEAGFKAQGSY